MRTSLWIVAILIMSGCGGTRDSQRKASSSHATPVVIEQPSLSDRLKYRHEQESEQEGMAMTEVDGAIKQ
jgi:hypothetical protein